MQTEITRLLGIKYPIIQGGMAWVAEHHLAAAVSEAGGLGLIGAASAPAEWVREQIRAARKLTDKPFGVNIMLMSPYAADVAKVIVEEGVQVVTTGAGSPGKYMEMWKEAGVKVIPVVASVALAKRMERAGADAIVAEQERQNSHIELIASENWVSHRSLMQSIFRLLPQVESETEEELQQHLCWEQRLYRWELHLLSQKRHRCTRITRIRF